VRKAFRILPTIVLLAVYFSCIVSANLVHATGSPRLAITLDDGNASQYTLAYPYLESKGLTATFAIPTYNISSGTFEGLTEMTWAQIRDLDDNGYEIASHGTGITGALTTSSEAVIQRELNGTYDDFDGNLSSVPTSFIIPWAVQNATVRIYESVYYRNAWSISGTADLYDANWVIDLDNDTILAGHQYRVPRVSGGAEYTNLNNSAVIIARYTGAIDQLVANQSAGTDSALALVFHHICEAPRYTGNGGVAYSDVTPLVFTTVVDYGIAQGCSFVTLSQLDSHFAYTGGDTMTNTVTDWMPSIISMAMLGVVIGFLKKAMG